MWNSRTSGSNTNIWRLSAVVAGWGALLTTSATAQTPPTWIRHFTGPGLSIDQIIDVAAGPDDTVAVTGRSRGAASNFDYLTIKYDAEGNELWTDRFNGPLNWIDEPVAVDMDAAGNVYVTGHSWNGLRPQGSEWDYVTIKYSATGERLWVQRYNGRGNWSDFPKAMVVDALGNVYVAGFAFVAPDVFNRYATHFHVLAYDTDGSIKWEHQIDDAARLGAGARDIALDAAGNVCATGVVNAGDPWNKDDNILTVKVGPEGNLIYAVQYSSPGSFTEHDNGRVLTADPEGNVYVAGQVFTDLYRHLDMVVLKYDPSGALLWESVGTLDRPDGPTALVVDGMGNLYVGGAQDNGDDLDALVVAFSSSGVERWRRVYAEAEYQAVVGVGLGGDGHLYVGIDWRYTDAGGYDPTLVRLTADGTLLDQARFDAGTASDELFAFDLHATNTVYLGGVSFFAETGSDYTTMKVSLVPSVASLQTTRQR